MNVLAIITELKRKKIIPRLIHEELHLHGDVSLLSPALLQAIEDRKQELKDFLNEALDRHRSAAILPVPWQPDYLASNAQQRIWMLCRDKSGNAAYNIVTPLYLKGALEKDRLLTSFQWLINRHESLRTVFREVNGSVRQTVLSPSALGLRYLDLRAEQYPMQPVIAEIRHFMLQVSDLYNGPLVGAALLQLSDDEHVFILSVHHLVSDGRSVMLMIKEIMQCYENGGGHNAPLSIQYKDYTKWLEILLNGEYGRRAKAFWSHYLSQAPDSLMLPSDFSRPLTRSFAGAVARFDLGNGFYPEINNYCKQSGVTPFNFLMATITLLLSKISGQQDIIIGTPVSGRSHYDLHEQIGLYVNVLPLRSVIRADVTWSEFLKQTADNTFRVFEYQDYPFDKIVNDLDLRWEPGHNPLFDVLMVLQDVAAGDGSMWQSTKQAIEMKPMDTVLPGVMQTAREQTFSKFDLSFSFSSEPGNYFYLEVEYASSLFTGDTIVRYFNMWQHIVKQLLFNPGTTLGSIKITDPLEEERVLQLFNKTEAPFDLTRQVTDQFEAQVRRTPDAIALVYGEQSFTYSRLNDLANQLAHYLRVHHQPNRDDRIAVKLPRSEWTIISILAVLKSGAAYVPIDLDYPAERISFIISDSSCKTTIDINMLEAFKAVREEYSKDNPDIIVTMDALAYVIYTSGSTGTPKGVMITHRNLNAFIHWCKSEFSDNDFDTVLGVTSICFDLSVFEIFFTLSIGKKLLFLPGYLAVPQQLSATDKFLLNTVPGVLNALLDGHADLGNVSVLNLAGEVLSPQLLSRIPDGPVVRNLYGPTETTIYNTVYKTKKDGQILIGRPIANTRIYILDEGKKPQPTGINGEIFIAGEGVGKGYLNRPDLTMEKFLPDPFGHGYMYRSGDLGRWLPDGNIAFVGRNDAQVKINGFRIEPGEVEEVLATYPGIGPVVVVPHTNMAGDKKLVAYLTGEQPIEATYLADYGKSLLPSYMIPSDFIYLSELPMMPNGKVNRKELQQRPLEEAPEINYSMPGNATEEKIALIWCELLHLVKVSITDNFFLIGGNSLKAIALASRLHQEFGVSVLLDNLLLHPTVAEMAAWIQQNKEQVQRLIPRAAIRRNYPLSAAQQQLWILSQQPEASAAYNMPGVYVMEGELVKDALEYAFRCVIERHEVLRTSFSETPDGDIRQIIHPDGLLPFNIACHHLVNEPGKEALLQQLLQAALFQPFDLNVPVLLRAFLYQVEEHTWIFACVLHHIIADGWSLDVLFSDIRRYYIQYMDDMALPPAALTIQYKDVAVWQNELLAENAFGQQRDYWLQQFQGELPLIDLPFKVRPAVKRYDGAIFTIPLDNQLVEGLDQVAKENGATVFMCMLAVLNTLLYRYTGKEDIIIGSPVAGREHAAVKDQMGLYIHMLALRTTFNGEGNFRDLVTQVRNTVTNAFKHQQYPYHLLVDALHLPMDPARNPLFDIVLTLWEETPGGSSGSGGLPNLRIRKYEPELFTAAKFDLLFDIVINNGAYSLRITYNTGLFNHNIIRSMAGHFVGIASAVIQWPDTSLSKLDYLSTREKEVLLGFSGTKQSFPEEQTVVQLFEQQVQQTPDNIAVVCGAGTLTYRALNEQANRIAARLRADSQVKPNSLIGVNLPKSESLIVAILGVLKSGAAYLPLDTGYPAERIRYMVEDSRCAMVIDENWLQAFHKLQEEYSAADPVQVNSPQDLVYVIYTSGSTGGPKGAMVRHNSFTNLVWWYQSALHLQADDCVLLMAPVSFDLAQKNIFAPLISGCRLCVPDDFYGDYYQLADTITARQVTVINSAPSAFYPLLDTIISDHYKKLTSVRNVVLGGEPVLMGELDGLITSGHFHGAVINSYGPTECTDVVSWYKINTDEWHTAGSFPIGIPVNNCRLYILDPQHQQLPMGCIGEIFISGLCVGNGYIYQPALTAEKFVSDPFLPGAVMYKTGDLGRWLPGGVVDFIGRKDEQIKIRGYRIEPGEIETALKQYPSVEAAVVIARIAADGSKELVACITGKEPLHISGIKAHLANVLAPHMLPATFIQLDHIPLTPSGKADRKALAALKGCDLSADVTHIPFQNEAEIALAAIWSDILDKEVLSAADNFLTLGGNSLKTIRLAAQIHRHFEVKVPVRELFENPLLTAQARRISELQKVSFSQIPALKEQSSYPLSASQHRIWGLSQLHGGSIAYHITGIYTLEGNLDIAALERAFTATIARHESLRTVFRENEQGEITQVILKYTTDFHIPVTDLTMADNGEEQLRGLLETANAQPFDLTTGPLLRAGLFHLANNSWVLIYVMHHIISDGWSTQILAAELSQRYNAYRRKLEIEITPLPFQYKDYVSWQLSHSQQTISDTDRPYWQQQFSGVLPVLNLYGDTKRPPVKTFSGGTVYRKISKEKSDRLFSLVKEVEGGTLFTALLSVVFVLLHRYTQQEDIVIGSPVAGRAHADLEKQIGLYINTLALRIRSSGHHDFRTLLAEVREVCLDAFAHQELAFEELVAMLPYKRDMSRNALFDVMVVLEDKDNQSHEQLVLDDLAVGTYPEYINPTSKVDLSFFFRERAAGLHFMIEYNSDIYHRDTIERMAGNFEVLLDAILINPAGPISELPFITAEERQKICDDFNDTSIEFPSDATFLHQFKEKVALYPAYDAVLFEEKRLSYRELDEASDVVAAYLAASRHLLPGDLVGVKLERSEWIIIVLLGIIKSGTAYIPVDPAYPQHRIDYMMSDSGCKLLFDEEELERFRKWPKGEPAVLTYRHQPNDTAYVIYTSGSTGTPKGVVISHHSLNTFINWCHLEFDRDDFDLVYSATSICFDLSVFEIFYTLTTGKSIRFLSGPLSIPVFLSREEKVLINTVPAVMGYLLNENIDLGGVTVVNMAGEPLPQRYADQLLSKGIVVRNLYGPSEDTTYSTCYKMQAGDEVLIGSPVSNTQLYILDKRLDIRPIGAVGEIYLSGDGLALSYLNKPDLTADKFITHPFRTGERLYKTGDLGRWTSNGNVVFIGREDSQVKIHGYRVELGEVEQALQQHKEVKNAVVLCWKNADGDDYLAAYIIVSESVPDINFKSYLSARLPAYMIPSWFIPMNEFPIGATGKIDRKLLPEPDKVAAVKVAYVPPSNEIEKTLQLIWKDLLHKDNIGIRDNFFDLGGHSLKAIQLIMRVKSIYHVSINLSYFLLEATIEELANQIAFVLDQEKQLRDKETLVQIKI